MAIFKVNNSNNRFTLQLTLTEGAINSTNNTSPVSYKLELIANTSYNFEKYAIGSKVIIDSETVHSQERTATKQYSIAKYGTLVLASGTKTITHDADGKKKISVSFSIDMASVSYTPGALSGSGTMDLTAIPRQAIVQSATDFSDEGNPTVQFSNAGGYSLVPYINFYMGGIVVKSVKRSKGTYSSPYTWNLTEAERKLIRTALGVVNGCYATVGFETYSGTEHIGDSSVGVNFSIVNANPTFTAEQVEYADTSSVVDITENPLHIVQNKSSLAVTFSAAIGNKEATIDKYKLALNGVTKIITSNGSAKYTVDFGAVDSSRDVTLSIDAIDSRANTTNVKKTITMLAYSPPIADAVVERLNNFEDTTYLKVNATFSSVNEKNEVTITYKYKKVDDAEYSEPEEIPNQTKITVGGDNGCDKRYAFLFSVTATDTFGGEDTKEYPLAKGVVPLFVNTRKNRVGINGFAEEGEALRVCGGVAHFEDGIVVDGAWNDLAVESDFTVYENNQQNRLQFKAMGNVVSIRGIMTINASEHPNGLEQSGVNTYFTMASGIPKEYRPEIPIRVVCQGSQLHRWLCVIGTDGKVTMGRYGTTELIPIPTNVWLPINITYLI